MKVDIEKLHTPKYGRRSGKTVEAICDAIGKIFVTENKVIPFVVREINWMDHIKPMFRDICIDHFNEQPILKDQRTLMIKGYTSKIVFFSFDRWWQDGRGYDIQPTYDL